MKKRTLRVLATAIVLSFSVGLFTGCGSGNSQGNSDSAQGSATAENNNSILQLSSCAHRFRCICATMSALTMPIRLASI